MTIEQYIAGFETIIHAESPSAPYDQQDYLEYTKLNFVRFKRWKKQIQLLPEFVDLLKSIQQPQNWVIISEHWCGDAAHITPILFELAKCSDKIQVSVQLRDSNSEIDQYLTNGGKAIPIFIVRNEHNEDIFHWGPRPVQCQELMNQLKAENASFDKIKVDLQNWYNDDKTLSTQQELFAHFKTALL